MIPDMKLFQMKHSYVQVCARYAVSGKGDTGDLCAKFSKVKFSKRKKLKYAGAPTPTDANNLSLTSERASWERKEWAGVGKG